MEQDHEGRSLDDVIPPPSAHPSESDVEGIINIPPPDTMDIALMKYKLEKPRTAQSFEKMLESFNSPYKKVNLSKSATLQGSSCEPAREDLLKCYSTQRSQIKTESTSGDESGDTEAGRKINSYQEGLFFFNCAHLVDSYAKCVRQNVFPLYFSQIAKAQDAAMRHMDNAEKKKDE